MRRNTGLKERKGFCEKLVGTQTCNFQRNHDVSTVINFAGAQFSDEPKISNFGLSRDTSLGLLVPFCVLWCAQN